MLRQKPVSYVFLVVSLVCYYFLAYEIPRHNTFALFTAFGILFLIYVWIVNGSSNQTVSFWIVVSLCFRATLLFVLPQLSDDFYRFIWDGRLWAAGQHPFAALPSEFLSLHIPGIDQDIYSRLNSKEYFAIYPPVSQYVFWIAVKISPHSILGSVMVMRVLVLLAEIGTIFLMKELLKKFNGPEKNVLFYALNPLIIMELTGNLHFEGFIIFFLLLAVFFLTRKRLLSSAAVIGLAICTKLLPLIFLPLFIGRLTVKNLITYFLIVATTSLVLFFPFFDWEVVNSLRSSVGLYFTKFEFNASLYYLVREFGFWRYGYNIIQTVGWKLGLITLILILIFVWIRNRKSKTKQDDSANHVLLQDWMWMLSIYFLFATTLHPWYISTLLALSVFTPYRYPTVWTGMILLTYAGYTADSFHEILWLTAIQYILVIGYLAYELWNRKSTLVVGWNKENLLKYE